MSRILQISSFPTVLPRHGGQRRAHQIARALERAGHHVSRAAIYTFSGYGWPPSEPAIDLDRYPVPKQPTTWLYDGVRAMEQDAQACASFARLYDEASPDLVLVEEVWLWQVIRHLPAVRARRIPIIYSSYNIEAPLFRRLLLTMGHPDATALAEDLSALEAEVATRADACCAVTEADAAALRAMGAHNVVVARNGVERRLRTHLKGMLPDRISETQTYVLYVASAHRPNASGIPDLFLAMMESLRPEERLVVAGGVCSLLTEWLNNGGPAHLARERLELLGDVSDFCLDGLIANAAGIVLPVNDGGGSNLKTAEALYSGLPLVATTTAMRGYESYQNMPGVLVADDPAEFAALMRKILDGSVPRRTPSGELDSLLWEHTLAPLVTVVNETVSQHLHAVAD